MSLFQCDNCGCVENTALAAQSYPEVFAELFDWTGIEEKKAMKLCSACGPTTYSDGTPTEYGKWHGQFDQTFLPKGKFKTSRNGNLEHIATGDQNYSKWKVKPFKKVDKLQSQVEQLQKQLKAMTEERDCWIANAKNLQVGYNDLDKRIRQLQSELAAATAGKVTIVKEKFYPADKELIEQLQQQVVMKFSEERVPQFSQGYKSHELLEPVTAEDCAFYVEQVEQLQAENARLRGWFSKDNSCKCNVCSACAERAASILASTNSSNWLAEQKAQWRREVLKEVYKEVNCGITHVRWALEIIHRMAEQPESNCACYPDDKDADKRQCNECPR